MTLLAFVATLPASDVELHGIKPATNCLGQIHQQTPTKGGVTEMPANLDVETVRFELEERRRQATMYRLARRGPARSARGAGDKHAERDHPSSLRIAWFSGQTGGRSRSALKIPICVAMGLLLLAGAGAGTQWARDQDAGPWAPPSDQGYLWRTSSQADFLNLTVNGSRLTGRLEGVDLRGTKVRSIRDSITGSVNGGQVTVHLDAGIFGSPHLEAHYQGSDFVVLVPESGGSPQSRTFTPSTDAQYSWVDRQFQRTAKANAQVAAALARADQQIDLEAQVFNATYTKVQNDVTNLPSDQYLGDGAQAANQAGAGLLTAASDKQKVVNEGPSAATCGGDAGTVGYDVGSVQYSQTSIRDDQQSFQGDVTNTSNDATALQNAQSAYEQALSGDPAHQDQVPSPSQVASVIQSLQGAQAQAQQTMTGYATWIAQDYSLAQVLAQQAHGICG